MEEEHPDKNKSSDTLKRPASPTQSVKKSQSKKVRLGFSGKEFRKRLKSDQKAQALQEFFQLLGENSKQDYILTYLEQGGSALEILQLIEGESGSSPVVIFEIVNRILLEISVKLVRYQNAAQDACRYLVNTYITLINKMLGLSSSTQERLATLKLLTTIVTCSVVLAKDILLHVNFNPTNLALLTKASEGKTEVRAAFIHFIVAFLVDGHFPALCVLLEKRGLMTSIIHGLKFDKADIVVLVLTAMKNHILENGSVSKTVKMKTFNTQVVKDIVNLYNWKGPDFLPNRKKSNKVAVVDEVDKSKVSEAIHSFLLVLCTSHKMGIIFKDPLVGLGKRQNQLMYTVLERLERPWEHSYAGELVIKICKACPDLTKTMWTNLKIFVEPRWTVKWLKSVQFARTLLEELQPDCIELCANNLTVQQIVQVITTLTSPISILKTLIPETQIFDQPVIKYHVLSLLLKMLESIEIYIKFFETKSSVDSQVLSMALANHIERNFPKISLILDEWDKTDEDLTVSVYLNTALDLLRKYKILAPKMFESDFNLDMKELIRKSGEILDDENVGKLQIKTVNLFLDLDPSLFHPKNELFRTVIKLSLELYYSSKDSKVLGVLNQLLKNSGFFDGCHGEIDFWIDGVLNLKKYDENVALFLCDLIQKVDLNATNYYKKIFECKGSNFSPLLLSLTEYFNGTEPSKTVKNYLSFVILNIFHTQVDCNAFMQVILNFQHLPDSLRTYITNWNNLEVTILSKSKGKLMERFYKFSSDFLENNLENSDLDLYQNLKLNLLQILIFYVTNLSKVTGLKDNHKTNCNKFINYLISENAFDDSRYLEVVFENPLLINNFTIFTSNDFLTKMVLDIAKGVKTSAEIYLVELRRKVVSTVSKMFRKPQKYENFVISFEVIETVALDYQQCSKLLEKFSDSYNRIFFQFISYCLDRMSELGKSYNLEPLSDDTVKKLSHFVVLLVKEESPNFSRLISSFHNYMKTFPHSLESVDSELFDSLVAVSEFNKENLNFCEFLLERKFPGLFEKNLEQICSKRSYILALLDVVVEQHKNNDNILEKIFNKFESHIVKTLQKPHKAGQHFHNRYQSVGFLIEKFMKPEGFGTQIQKFETTELFHVYLLKKVYDKVEKNDKILSNMIMTFVHLLMSLLKQKNGINYNEIGEIFFVFLKQIEKKNFNITLSKNESFKMFCKLCLKYGVSGDFILLKILTELIEFTVEEDEGKLILEMLLSHSHFIDIILGDSRKDDSINLWRTICGKWPQFMERSHVPLLLSAYKATNADAITLDLIKMYEKKPDQTKFFDFKPFLWGRAAASHYSVRSDVQKVLWRQPKMVDVVNNLHLGTIVATVNDPTASNAYDLDYFLPLFSHLLSPENPVTTYRFTKTGALALALVGFRGDKSQRLATCYVLQRFYFHLEAKQRGKDNLLWLRFIEAICKGVSVFDDYKINNFVGVFLARTALILAQPNDVMYVPLTQYLTAKDSLDFSTIPELYTFLHSPHVDSKEHKYFILEVLRDGLWSEKDFTTLLKTMGFKLISELCSSTVCDLQTKVFILEVFEECCKFELGVKVLCGSLSFLAQIFSLVLNNVQERLILGKLLNILLRIVEIDTDRQRNFIIYLNLITLADDETYFRCLVDSKVLGAYYHILMVIVKRFPAFFDKAQMDNLLKKSEDSLCKYLVQYGCRFIKEVDLECESHFYYLRLLFYDKLKIV